MPNFCGLFDVFNFGGDVDNNSKEASDSSASKLSYVGKAAYDCLRYQHAWHHRTQWNVTSGKVIGSLHQTPSVESFSTSEDPAPNHDDWFPDKMKEIIIKTTVWCDVLSLGPPDGLFLTKFKEALSVICETSMSKSEYAQNPIIVRMMFGNIVGMPVNCTRVIEELTKDLPLNANVELWVGAWRKGTSWNHAKIIAIDGRYLFTGGHNLWDPHYLRSNPVHDVSVELEGRVTHDGHLFANDQWKFIRQSQSGLVGQCAEKVPDGMPLIWQNRVIVSEWPTNKTDEFPPKYTTNIAPRYDLPEKSVPVLSIGRLGTLTINNRPADEAILAMIDASKTIIRMSLQDLGPVCVPRTKMALPGLKWPKETLQALARAIWLRGVDVEIVLSNPVSIPGGLGITDACYGNGWSCVDVAAEIIKRIKKQFPKAKDSELRTKVEENLRICFIRHDGVNVYADGKSIGNHSKFFIIDDIAAYIGSQNLYMCDLAEWGVVIDDDAETKKMITDFWNPLWKASYTALDCDVNDVMDDLDIDRDGEDLNTLTVEGRMKAEMAAIKQAKTSGDVDMYGTEVNVDFFGKEVSSPSGNKDTEAATVQEDGSNSDDDIGLNDSTVVNEKCTLPVQEEKDNVDVDCKDVESSTVNEQSIL